MALVPGQLLQSEMTAASPDMISAYIQQYLTEQAVMIQTVIDRSADVGNNKSVDYLRTTGLTAETKAESTAYTAQKFTVAADTLLLDKQKGVYVEAETRTRLQTVLNLPIQTLQLSADALVQQLEADVYAALRQAAAANRVKLETSNTLSLADIFNACDILDEKKVPLADRFLMINTRQRTDVAKLQNFIHADKYGTMNNVVLKNGELGRIAGFTVLASNNVTVNEAVAYHRTHVVFGRQYAVTWEQDRSLKDSLDQYLLETLYGLKTLDLGVRGVLLNNAGAL